MVPERLRRRGEYRGPRGPAELAQLAARLGQPAAGLRHERALEVARVGVAVAGGQRRVGLAARHEDLLHGDEARQGELATLRPELLLLDPSPVGAAGVVVAELHPLAKDRDRPLLVRRSVEPAQ